jgi:hypothetical protein
VGECVSEYQGLEDRISSLQIHYLSNSQLAALTFNQGVAFKVSPHTAYDENILQSDNVQLKACTVGQILNLNRFQAPQVGIPSRMLFWERFARRFGFCAAILGMGSFCSVYKHIDLKKWAYVAAGCGIGYALLGLYGRFQNSDTLYAGQIGAMKLNLQACDKSNPLLWLQERSFQTGAINELNRIDPDEGTADPAASQIDVTYADQLPNAVLANIKNFQAAHDALAALPKNTFDDEAKGYFARVHHYTTAADFYGGGCAAVIALAFAKTCAGKLAA